MAGGGEVITGGKTTGGEGTAEVEWEDAMQHPLMGSVEGGREEELAIREAWGYALDGFRKALAVRGLPNQERATLLACLHGASEIAGQPHLQDASRQSALP